MTERTETPGTEQLEDLVTAATRLAQLGLSYGSSGNVSIRMNELIIMSPTGADLSALDATNLSVLNFEGTLLSGPKASKEFPFHRAMYRKDPDNRAIVHVHSTHAVAVSCMEPWSPKSAVPPLTPYFVMRVGQAPLIPYAQPGDETQAKWIENAPFPFRAALLQNHGLITASTSIQKALEAAIELEEVCKLLLLLGNRTARTLERDQASQLAAKYASHWTP